MTTCIQLTHTLTSSALTTTSEPTGRNWIRRKLKRQLGYYSQWWPSWSVVWGANCIWLQKTACRWAGDFYRICVILSQIWAHFRHFMLILTHIDWRALSALCTCNYKNQPIRNADFKLHLDTVFVTECNIRMISGFRVQLGTHASQSINQLVAHV